jgi:hypothetical protein
VGLGASYHVDVSRGGRLRALVGDNHVGLSAYDGAVLPLVSEPREHFKSGRSSLHDDRNMLKTYLKTGSQPRS